MGQDAEKVMYGRATNLAKKLAEQDMEQNKLREMVRAALTQSLPEKKEFPDLTGDGKVTKADILKGRGIELKEGPEDKFWATYVKSLVNDIRLNGVDTYVDYSEDDFIEDYENYLGDKMGLEKDIDLGHVDNEPHMIKAELYRIGKYAMELYQMLDGFEGEMEVDFPAWWQAKLTTAMNNMVSAKHYLDFELKEPAIDAAVDAMTGEEPHMNEGVTSDFEEKIDQIVNHYFNGDQEVKKAAIEYASLKGARVMGGRSATASLFKDFFNNHSSEVAHQAIEVIDMADIMDKMSGIIIS